MYYNITNAIGTDVAITSSNGTIIELVCGNVYAKKVKSHNEASYVLAFSKADDGWRFDGQAILDFEKFVDEVDPEKRDILAWKSEKINIQAKIRPSKDSKKAIKQAQFQADKLDIETRHASGDITDTELAQLAMDLIIKNI